MQDLQTKSNIGEMFNIQEKEDGEIAISGRELHKALEVKTRYNDWFERMINYGFEENNDYTALTQKRVTAQGNAINYFDHALTLDTAKEIAMIQRSEPGKRARQYFIQVEKAWNSPEMIMKRALKMANNTINQLETQIEKNKPKVLFADAVATTKTSILVGELAKIIKQNGVNIGQRRLFEWLRQNGFLIKRQGVDYNMPTQYSMERELFEIKETSITHSDGHTSISKTPKVTGKGQQYFINKFLAEEL
ncbi:phage antirepressor KilAC domain-containing protein (plasmid) [Staphylococcus epidermidis]|jgi:anti-repressor protein|uniref:anti-repressor n=1 Tax=Staphylococcus phage StB20-like TaxID=1732064 RepID=UPI00032DD308|nr:phage antirepressor KilAC domain-containing protein [Staphylococcus epidermidis]YP_009200571.1 anti-repressor [Staphylococcus phage StB20-like]EON85281.1 phage antirepressor protein [Staphylococcus epidermidis 36-1]MDU7414459.1 phage antirepressor KilAC domain-containing protein [Varibaculum cambriense]ALH46751.1 antirepressor protein KilAC domain protein [Staphylococcus phage StB20-like]MBF8057590.1 phage antirepressor KilAC domain-containing protein [Staphylococcus epidermidis]MCG1394330